MNFIKKTGIILTTALVLNVGMAHAQTLSGSIGSTFKNAVDAGKENGAQNSALRNQLVTDHSSDIQNKEKTLVDQLNLALLNLENIQTRIATKTAETAASGTDTSSVNLWLASSSADIIIAQNNIALFASSTIAASSAYQSQTVLAKARKLADDAIGAVNLAHNDLQSALDVLTNIL